MSEFKREERYIVIKRKRIDDVTEHNLKDFLVSWQIPTEECVVVEHDWPENEIVWDMIKSRMTGKLNKYQQELEVKEKEITGLRNAPIDGEIPELDAVCERFNKGEFDLTSLVCKVWNTSVAVNNEEDEDND